MSKEMAHFEALMARKDAHPDEFRSMFAALAEKVQLVEAAAEATIVDKDKTIKSLEDEVRELKTIKSLEDEVRELRATTLEEESNKEPMSSLPSPDLEDPSISRASRHLSVHPSSVKSAHHSTITGAEYTPNLSKTLCEDTPKRGITSFIFPWSLYKEITTVCAHHSTDWFGYKAFKDHPAVVLNAALYTWSFSFLTSASFGLLFNVDTSGTFGVATSFLSGGMTGLFMSLLGGQPLVLYGQTGPIVLLYVYCYEFAHENGIPFHGFVAWMGVWSALQHFAIAIAGLNDVKYLNYLLVAADYITAGIIGFYNNFTTKSCSIPECASTPSVNYLNGTFNLLLGLFFFDAAIRMQRSSAGGISFGTYKVRRILSQYGCLLSLLVVTLLSYAPQWDRVNGWPNPGIPERVNVSPSTWGNPRLDLSLGVSEMGR
ncbi:hypothetical protein TrRE_jg9627 [Triparma retinervis]|uniref:Bicarbonate transporter-like transmembrane domain-containing protein n=1 Tax=Triparma retinervis TaxID=2557542 RepID=A0A9W6ZJR3_9STRA|nr:hypothetical protein TrRE_jg9627 [Triparma retinervis]